MTLSMRYGLVGIAALALLSGVHGLRGWQTNWHPVSAFLLGVTPNVVAAIAIPFVFIAIWADQNKGASFHSAHRWFIGSAVASCLGLLIWEMIQRKSSRLIFDPNDIVATFFGLAIAIGAFHLVTPRSGRPPDKNTSIP